METDGRPEWIESEEVEGMDAYTILQYKRLEELQAVAALVEQAAATVYDLLSFVENEGNGFESEDDDILTSIGNKLHLASAEFVQYLEMLTFRQGFASAESPRGAAQRSLTQLGAEAGEEGPAPTVESEIDALMAILEGEADD